MATSDDHLDGKLLLRTPVKIRSQIDHRRMVFLLPLRLSVGSDASFCGVKCPTSGSGVTNARDLR